MTEALNAKILASHSDSFSGYQVPIVLSDASTRPQSCHLCHFCKKPACFLFYKFYLSINGALRHLILIQNNLYIYYFSKTLEGFSGAKGKINEHELGLRIGFAYTKG